MYSREELKILWLPYNWLNCYQFSWPNCYFCQCMLISIIIINSWAEFFVTQGSPGTLQLLYKKEAGKGHGGGVCPRKAPQGPAQLQLCCLGLCRQVWNNLGNRLQEVSTGNPLWGAYSQISLAGRHYGFTIALPWLRAWEATPVKCGVCNIFYSLALTWRKHSPILLEHQSPVGAFSYHCSVFLFIFSFFSLSRFNFPTTVSLKSLLWSYTSFLSPNLSLSSVTSPIFILFSLPPPHSLSFLLPFNPSPSITSLSIFCLHFLFGMNIEKKILRNREEHLLNLSNIST